MMRAPHSRGTPLCRLASSARHEDVEACRFWQVYHVICTNSGRTDAGRRRKREPTGREASDDAVAA